MLQVKGNALQGGEVEISWDGIHERRRAQQEDWYTYWYCKRSSA